MFPWMGGLMRIKLLFSVLAFGLVVSNSISQQPKTTDPQAMSPNQMNPQQQYQQQAPYFIYYIPKAPDMTGPGFYYTNCYGVTYGPNYCVTPPFAPCNGPLPAFGAAAMNQKPKAYPGMSFPTHPYVRSARDYFMVD